MHSSPRPAALTVLKHLFDLDVTDAYTDPQHRAHAIATALLIAATEYDSLTDVARQAAQSAKEEVARIANAIETTTVRMYVGTGSHGVEMDRATELSLVTARLVTAEQQLRMLSEVYRHTTDAEIMTAGQQA